MQRTEEKETNRISIADNIWRNIFAGFALMGIVSRPATGAENRQDDAVFTAFSFGDRMVQEMHRRDKP
jgi:hypothetical protein